MISSEISVISAVPTDGKNHGNFFTWKIPMKFFACFKLYLDSPDMPLLVGRQLFQCTVFALTFAEKKEKN